MRKKSKVSRSRYKPLIFKMAMKLVTKKIFNVLYVRLNFDSSRESMLTFFVLRRTLRNVKSSNRSYVRFFLFTKLRRSKLSKISRRIVIATVAVSSPRGVLTKRPASFPDSETSIARSDFLRGGELFAESFSGKSGTYTRNINPQRGFSPKFRPAGAGI